MIYVTSDLHGYPLDSFLKLLEKACFGDGDFLYVLGDVIDRNGDGGVAMLEWMLGRPNIRLLLGNHEDMLLSCRFLFREITDDSIRQLGVHGFNALANWLRNGGEVTIESLKRLRWTRPEALDHILDCLKRAPLYARVATEAGRFLLVHSGMSNFSANRPMSDYTSDELLWHRPAPDERFFDDALTILGHTPTRIYGNLDRMFVTPTWIDIDTGAAGGRNPMLLRLDDLTPFYVQ